MPASVVRHLTILQCGKVALSGAICKDSGDDAWCGAADAAMGILSLIIEDPVELKRCARFDGIS